MSELDPETGIIRAVSEAQIIEDFGKYEGITITRVDGHTVKATFQETFGEGSATGKSVLNVLIHAVRAQKNKRYWDGYYDAEEKFIALLRELPIAVTLTKRDQNYVWQALEQNGVTYSLLDAAAQGLYSLIEQLGYKPETEEQNQ